MFQTSHSSAPVQVLVCSGARPALRVDRVSQSQRGDRICARPVCSTRVTSPSYERGQPKHSALYKLLQDHLATFLQTAAAHDDTNGVPRFVEKELRAFLDCGVLARGLIRLHCTECARDHVIGLSCKGRGFVRAAAAGA
jgi:hypothetical protein